MESSSSQEPSDEYDCRIHRNRLLDRNKVSQREVVENSRFGKRIPSRRFRNDLGRRVRKTHLQDHEKHSRWKDESPISEEKDEAEGVSEIGIKNSTCAVPWRREINLDWGERRQLHDVTKFNDGDLIWGIVNLGMFANIKLWVNEYGYICCLASGKISKVGSSEMTYVSLTDTSLLRKMLNLTHPQWAALCESVIETKTILKFDAFQAFEPKGKTLLEKMWFLICKRRHFLPRQCMLLKYCGAIKCMRRLDIIPKLVVHDIRNVLEEPAL